MRLECGCDVDINGEAWETCEEHKPKNPDEQSEVGVDVNIVVACKTAERIGNVLAERRINERIKNSAAVSAPHKGIPCCGHE